LLPAGAKVAGWVFHPLRNAAFARRTPKVAVQQIHLYGNNVLKADIDESLAAITEVLDTLLRQFSIIDLH
jgi:hypothetical protein